MISAPLPEFLCLRRILLDGRLVGDNIAHHAAVSDDAFTGDTVGHAGAHAVNYHGDRVRSGYGIQLCNLKHLLTCFAQR